MCSQSTFSTVQVLTTVQKGEGPQTVAQDASSWVLNSSPRSPTGRGKEEGYSDKGGWHKVNPPQRWADTHQSTHTHTHACMHSHACTHTHARTHTHTHSPTISSTLKNLSVVYREQGRLDAANELDKLTERRTLDQSQRERMNELLSDFSSSPAPSQRASQVGRAPQGSNVSHSVNPHFCAALVSTVDVLLLRVVSAVTQ